MDVKKESLMRNCHTVKKLRVLENVTSSFYLELCRKGREQKVENSCH